MGRGYRGPPSFSNTVLTLNHACDVCLPRNQFYCQLIGLKCIACIFLRRMVTFRIVELGLTLTYILE